MNNKIYYNCNQIIKSFYNCKGFIMKKLVLFSILMGFCFSYLSNADVCIDCHKKKTPNIVKDWQLSKHSDNDVSCSTCHGDKHKTMTDFANVDIPTPETCATCHEDQVSQFKSGKHAYAWAAIKAMPTIHWQPQALVDGQKGCGGCHKLGIKSKKEIKELKKKGNGFGVASCDACHTRHTFSVKEAKSPQACKTCHMGFDHPQWEMYSSSKHGVRNKLKQMKIIHKDAAAPTCQTCHMSEGNHAVKTAWGFLAVRLPMPENKQWASDRATILMALGVLDPNGKPTKRLDVVKAADVARLDQKSWQEQRDKMIKICSNCHSKNFAKGELKKGDDMIRESDKLMAQAIRTVAGLYKDKIIPKPKTYAYAFPDLLTFHDASTTIEQRLFKMFLKHRMRAFQGTYHASPDYALWYGWSELVQDVREIKTLAEELRERHKH